jgi:hypothetical protein
MITDEMLTMVRQAIEELQVDPDACKKENKHIWSLSKGAADIWLELFYLQKEGRVYIQVLSPIYFIPETSELKYRIFEELLHCNDAMFGVAFTLFENQIFIKVIREMEDIDKSEILAMLLRVGNYADYYKTYLKDKYHLKS